MNLDTRSKIVGIEQARTLADAIRREGGLTTAFVTHLEVLQAAHIRKLEDAVATADGKRTLFLILTDPVKPLEPLDARADVAAGLRAVDYVIPAADGASNAIAAIAPDAIVEDEEEDRARTRELIEHVRTRSRV